MGIIIAKFRKKPSTFDVLTKLENEIVSIEEFQKRTEQTHRKIVFRFVLLAILIYVGLAFLLYLYFSQISPNQKLFWSIPLVAFPFVIWVIKKFLTWYFNRKIRKNEKKLVTLKEKKKKMLENVMETETYKVAKQILDKFANEPKKSIIATPTVQRSTSVMSTQNQSQRLFESGLRQRNIAAQNLMRGRISFGGPPETPRLVQQQLSIPTPGTRRPLNAFATPGQLALTPAAAPLPRSILPKDRSVLDKMVDYLVGDGPSNRFALICQRCSGHNGMALKEEFEYLSFVCCYCQHFNPARKKKPVGPKFDSPPINPAITSGRAESSDSEENSENDSDSDANPIIEEPRSDSPDIRTSDVERISEPESRTEESRMEIDDNADLVDNAADNAVDHVDNVADRVDISGDHADSVDCGNQEDTAKITDLKESGDSGDVVNKSGDIMSEK